METPRRIKLSEIKEITHVAHAKARALTEMSDGKSRYEILNSGLDDYARILFKTTDDLELWLRDASLMKRGEPIRVLDYGCGTNRFAGELVDRFGGIIPLEVVGVSVGDVVKQGETAKAYTEHRNRSDVTFIDQKSVMFIPPGKFDLIVSITTVRHLPDPLRTMRTLYNSLEKGGELRMDAFRGSFYNWFGDDARGGVFGAEEAESFFSHLREQGIDISFDGYTGAMAIKKGDAKFAVKGLHYSPPAQWNTERHPRGQYTFTHAVEKKDVPEDK